MRLESRALVWDAIRAGELIGDFVGGASFAEYLDDAKTRSAVERQFEIIGEALNQLSNADPSVAATIPDLRRIVAFRNVLIHGYAKIDDAIVWEVVETRLDVLLGRLRSLLED
jgi:uncharacterized protein with HEPN domain